MALPVNGSKHLILAYYSCYRPRKDGLPTLVVTHQLQVERRTGKVRRPETDVLPLCHATNDWLHAPPITEVGLRLSDEAIGVAVAHRLGSKACKPHTCVCVCVVRQWMHVGCMDYPTAEALPDNNVTVI